jgi:hypothetical protein
MNARRQLFRDAIRWVWTCRQSWSKENQYAIHAWTVMTKSQTYLATPDNASGAGFWISGWIPETPLAQPTTTLNTAMICAQHEDDTRFANVQITIRTQPKSTRRSLHHTQAQTSCETESTVTLREVRKPKWRLHLMHHRWFLAEPTHPQHCKTDSEYDQHMATKDNPNLWNTTTLVTSSVTTWKRQLD